MTFRLVEETERFCKSQTSFGMGGLVYLRKGLEIIRTRLSVGSWSSCSMFTGSPTLWWGGSCHGNNPANSWQSKVFTPGWARAGEGGGGSHTRAHADEASRRSDIHRFQARNRQESRNRPWKGSVSALGWSGPFLLPPQRKLHSWQPRTLWSGAGGWWWGGGGIYAQTELGLMDDAS